MTTGFALTDQELLDALADAFLAGHFKAVVGDGSADDEAAKYAKRRLTTLFEARLAGLAVT